MLNVFAVLSGLSATRKLMPDQPGEGTIVRFLTFAETTRKQSPRIPLGAGNINAGGELVTAQDAPAHQVAFRPMNTYSASLSFDSEQLGFATVSILVLRNHVHDYFPSDISEWRLSCSKTISSNLQPSIKSAAAGLALKLRTTWNGWKSTVTLGLPCFAECRFCFTSPSSFRKVAVQR